MPLLKEGVQGEPPPPGLLKAPASIGVCTKQALQHPFPSDSLSLSPFPSSVQWWLLSTPRGVTISRWECQ